jgi:hypothetical protein
MPEKSYEGRTFWRLRDHVGPEPDLLEERDKEGDHKRNPRKGEPGALVEQPVAIPFPAMQGDQVVIERREVVIRPSAEKAPEDWRESKLDGDSLTCARVLPRTRDIETTAPPVAEYLDGLGSYEQIDPPASEQPHRPKEASK